MTLRLFALIAFLILPSVVQAGPWLREKGSGFRSFSFASTARFDTATQSYFEYGFSDAMTLGLDLNYFRPSAGAQGGIATLFLRRAITAPDATSKWAYEIGLGATWGAEEINPHLETGLTWGRGITLREKSGWATVDAAVLWDVSHARHVAKIDGTVGLNFSDRYSAMMQLFVVHVEGASVTTLAPSLIIAPENAKFRIQIGAEAALGDLSGTALKIGLWRDF